ncbi:MAG: type restriction enzyme protein [Actinomycetota bacterium]|jgi:type I restriction enzyme M protein|nr:type restriction enzyme protein [Actinomycetota bacterium]
MTLTNGGNFNDKVNFIWSVADLLRGTYKQSEYGRVILPFVVIRRLDCVLEDSKPAVLARAEQLSGRIDNPNDALCAAAGHEFYNLAPIDFAKLTADPEHVADNLRAYIGGFSPSAREVVDKFRFEEQIKRLDEAGLLYLVISRFAAIDLHPEVVGSTEMGYIYEELIRRFSEQSNETAGEHFTPREVIRLMVNLLFAEDDPLLRDAGVVKTLLDPACGTGGMLAVAAEHLRAMNPNAHLEVFGQELNDESFAICRSDMMLKGQSSTNIVPGNSFSTDGFVGRTFDYLLANPPFGVEWKNVETAVKAEAKSLGFAGRFGAGLPRINDGSMLFLQHMISKMRPPKQGGSRLAIVFNSSPLFTGAAGSGESEIRRWILENDWLDAIVALPDQLFYNTGISTYLWLVTNRKRAERRGKVQLIDARELFVRMRKSLGDKRKEISPEQIDEITHLYGDFTGGERVRILPNESFGFQRITVERPLRLRWEITDLTAAELSATKAWTKLSAPEQLALTEHLDTLAGTVAASEHEMANALGPLPRAISAEVWKHVARSHPEGVLQTKKNQMLPDAELREQESVPLPPGTPIWDEADVGAAKRLADAEHRDAVDAYIKTEVLPWVPDAWVDHSKTRIGYEVPLTRHFYHYTPPRPVAEIDAEIKALEAEIRGLLDEVTE